MRRKYSSVAHFVAIYIKEAHAADQWPIGNFTCVNQHKTQEERLNAARDFVAKYQFELPVLVDCIDDRFNTLYAAWPERFFVIGAPEAERTGQDPAKLVCRMKLIGDPKNEWGYDRSDIDQYLERLLNPPTVAVVELPSFAADGATAAVDHYAASGLAPVSEVLPTGVS
jgi:hypothetical protein